MNGRKKEEAFSRPLGRQQETVCTFARGVVKPGEVLYRVTVCGEGGQLCMVQFNGLMVFFHSYSLTDGLSQDITVNGFMPARLSTRSGPQTGE